MGDKRISVGFYKNETGSEPVRDWLQGLDREEKKLIGEDIKTVEYGYPIGMPTCRPLGNGLYEVRTNLNRKIARVFFCVHEEKMMLLHGFIKKTQKTPQKELDIALKRKRIVEKGER